MSSGAAHDGDLALVRAARAGDGEARSRLAARLGCVPRILAVRNGRSGSPLESEEVADLAQDVLLTVWRKLDEYAGRASIETWVYRFCSLELFNAVRRRARRPRRMSDVPEAERPPEPAAPPETGDSAEELERLLRALSPREAEVVRLRHVDLLEFREIAEGLGISTSSAKTHYYRGIEKLRELGEPREESEG